eukprot:scaffold6058_cov40-Tisochrysis_lutea.AAC.2
MASATELFPSLRQCHRNSSKTGVKLDCQRTARTIANLGARAMGNCTPPEVTADSLNFASFGGLYPLKHCQQRYPPVSLRASWETAVHRYYVSLDVRPHTFTTPTPCQHLSSFHVGDLLGHVCTSACLLALTIFPGKRAHTEYGGVQVVGNKFVHAIFALGFHDSVHANAAAKSGLVQATKLPQCTTRSALGELYAPWNQALPRRTANSNIPYGEHAQVHPSGTIGKSITWFTWYEERSGAVAAGRVEVEGL